jgi:UDP-glucose:(heptosyl)LPS alpha-1,3-glucosyltransferase
VPPLRIAVVADGFDPGRGGAETIACRLVEALEHRGHVVRRIAPPEDFGRVRRALELARSAEAARRNNHLVVSLCKAPGDVLVPQGGVHLAALWGSLGPYAPLLRPLVAALKLFAPRQLVFLAVEKRQYAGARRLVAISQRVCDDMVRLCGADERSVHICRHGVDLERFHPPSEAERRGARRRFGIGDGTFCVLFASHNYRLRGLERLIRAVGLTAPGGAGRAGGGTAADTAILVAGRGRPARYAKLAAQLGVRLVLAGHLDDIEHGYHAADVLAHPTFYDTSSLVVLEALASGLPVITTPSHGGAEFLRGPEGIVVPDGRDAEPLADALLSLRSPVRRRSMARAARATAALHPLEEALALLVRTIEGAAGQTGWRRLQPALVGNTSAP